MSPFIRTLIFTVVVAGFWTVAMPYWMLPRGVRPELRGASLLGLPLIAAGAALSVATAFWGFALRGKGTPAPIYPPKKLVAEGPYRVVRNPRYLAGVSVLLVQALVF